VKLPGGSSSLRRLTILIALLVASCASDDESIDRALADNTLPAPADDSAVTAGEPDLDARCRTSVESDITPDEVRQILRRQWGVEVEDPSAVGSADFMENQEFMILFDRAHLYLSADGTRTAVVVVAAGGDHRIATTGMAPVEATTC
jgi:hypothetical protein